MKDIAHLKKFYFEGGFTPNTSIDLSESGYLINELAISLLEHFDARTSKSTTRQWRILIWDRCKSHVEYEVLKWCWKHYIVPFNTIPHSTHFLQSLDVVCFQPYKHYHRQALDQVF